VASRPSTAPGAWRPRCSRRPDQPLCQPGPRGQHGERDPQTGNVLCSRSRPRRAGPRHRRDRPGHPDQRLSQRGEADLDVPATAGQDVVHPLSERAAVAGAVRAELPGVLADRAPVPERRIRIDAGGAQRLRAGAAADRSNGAAAAAGCPPRLAVVTPRLAGGPGDLTRPVPPTSHRSASGEDGSPGTTARPACAPRPVGGAGTRHSPPGWPGRCTGSWGTAADPPTQQVIRVTAHRPVSVTRRLEVPQIRHKRRDRLAVVAYDEERHHTIDRDNLAPT
jgi:hypothetical protein